MPKSNTPASGREQELFLLKKCNEICDLSYDYNDSPWLRPDAASKILNEVDAFSAKRAREKAIEECKAIVQGYIESKPYFPLHRVQERMDEIKSL